MEPSGPGLLDVPPAGEYDNLYPSTGADTGSQATRKRVYHSSDTRRFLGLSRATMKRQDDGDKSSDGQIQVEDEGRKSESYVCVRFH